MIGSSLLFVHDRNQASIWLIDFAKTVSLPDTTNITHSSEWIVGNHEDGYLIGINNLIQIFEELQAQEATTVDDAIDESKCDLDIDAIKIDQTHSTSAGSSEDKRNQEERD